MKRIMYLSIAVATLALFGCEKSNKSENQQSQSSPPEQAKKIDISRGGAVTVPGIAYLDGRDLESSPPLTLMRINVWDNAPRKKSVCKITHGEQVKLEDSRYVKSERRYYFKVKYGSCAGWIPESFINTAKHPPIGDKMFG